MGNQTELKRRQRDDAYVETVVNQACRSITFQAKTLGVESLVESIRSTKKLSKRAKNRLDKWEKGTVADRLTHWSARHRTQICWVSAAYTSQIDNRNGTLLGTRCRDQFFTFDGVVFQSDHNAAINLRHRMTDSAITQFMPYKQVQAVLLERTARFLNAMGLTLQDAVDRLWLDIKHTQCEAFQKLLHGL
ncbi:transposase [Scytonema sp. UIC 10036]|uniref:transposase n=1 Tax=Scytonema sp. UIC 10036 TaxID=2304196 RepID=UPI0012DA0430|nr:transposase [Scytonema sp. UIC 10036]MUG99185.1 transposase [Scytonema sp. UIC 10036]